MPAALLRGPVMREDDMETMQVIEELERDAHIGERVLGRALRMAVVLGLEPEVSEGRWGSTVVRFASGAQVEGSQHAWTAMQVLDVCIAAREVES
jgi:hypothetical protein